LYNLTGQTKQRAGRLHYDCNRFATEAERTWIPVLVSTRRFSLWTEVLRSTEISTGQIGINRRSQARDRFRDYIFAHTATQWTVTGDFFKSTTIPTAVHAAAGEFSERMARRPEARRAITMLRFFKNTDGKIRTENRGPD
jgi:hypothetical protein